LWKIDVGFAGLWVTALWKAALSASWLKEPADRENGSVS